MDIKLAERISRISVSATMRVGMEAERLRSEGADVVDFGAGEPDFPTPDNIKRAASDAMHNNFTKYTAAGGTMELRKAICERHRQDFGTDYQAPECIVSVGGKHVIFNAVSSLIGEGDEVVLPVPYWVTFADVVNYNGGKCHFVETDEARGFELMARQIEEAITPRTKLVIINSPSNPSGAVLDREEFEKILAITARKGVMLMSDECYCHFVYEGQPFSIGASPQAKGNVIIVGSLSKTYAMTGWRVGYGLAPPALISSMLKLQSHSTSNPNSIAQKAAVEAVRGPQESVGQMLSEYCRRREFVLRKLREIPGVTCATPRGAFYAYPNIGKFLGKDGMNSTLDFAEKLLQKAHVAVVPGEAFGTNAHVRISYATSLTELDRGIARLRDFVAEYA